MLHFDDQEHCKDCHKEQYLDDELICRCGCHQYDDEGER